MPKIWIAALVVVIALSLGADPVADAQHQSDVAQAALAAARNAAEQKFWASRVGMSLAADIATKQAARDRAQQSGTVQERLESGGDLNRARIAASKTLTTFLATDPSVTRAAAESQKAKAGLEAAKDSAAQTQDDHRRQDEAVITQSIWERDHPELSSLQKMQQQGFPKVHDSDEYASYKSRTQKMLDALSVIKQDKKFVGDELKAISRSISQIEENWRKTLSEREAIYPSSDSVADAVKCLASESASLIVIDEWAPKYEDARANGLTRSAAVCETVLTPALDNFEQSKKNYFDDIETVRRNLLTREGMSPALPSDK